MYKSKIELDKYVPWSDYSCAYIELDNLQKDRHYALAIRIKQLR